MMMRTTQAKEEFLRSRVARNLRPTSIEWYRDKLDRFEASCPKLPKKPGPIESYLAALSGCPETIHAHYRSLRAMFNFISERFNIPNPMLKVAPPRCPKKVMATLEPDEEMRLLVSASSLRDRAILTLFVDNGIRTGELAGLRRQDIGAATVRVSGKCGEREAPISEETRRLLLILMASNGKHEHVFYGPKGPLTRYGIYKIVRSHMTRAGVRGRKLGAHRLRHAFGKAYLVNGGDLRSLQEIMGHASIITTQRYASLNLTDTINKHRQFTPLRSAQAAAQGLMFEDEAIAEAERIVHR